MSGWEWMDSHSPRERDQHDAWLEDSAAAQREREAFETEQWVNDQMEALLDRALIDSEWDDLMRRTDAGEYDEMFGDG